MAHLEAAAWWAARLSSPMPLLSGRVVLTLGTFDLLHVGHLELLAACRALAGSEGRVIVGVNPDVFVTRFKGQPPVIPYRQRVEMLRATRFVDVVIRNIGEEDSRPAIETAQPDVIAIGSDWEDRDYLRQLGVTEDWLDERGLRIEYVPRTRQISSTSIKAHVVAAA